MIEEKINIGANSAIATKSVDSAHSYVDLGLPSGTKWAAMNIGAEKETDYGLYFAWGETQVFSKITDDKKINWDGYKYRTGPNITKYNATDGLTTLEASDDAATVNWGGNWKMPTAEQISELLDISNCTNEWVKNYNDSGINGRIFTSVRNGNKLFFPAAGCWGDGAFNTFGMYGVVWSCTLSLDAEYGAQCLYFFEDEASLDPYYSRCVGLPIRPVIE